ncbi:MAG TPA: DNA adenine methylase [Polyangiaceae bacterium]|jgi:DNA adenine methylase|nr:MAG: Modification methylase DpnIIA [Deltaproteobacteria bacterium ADurb.Bin207]HNS95816.1 DNA adenine methylase [Polyangiaceae bacterium]HNZ24645.1 DNA adenine methylase [Polyangiaceae bacterium]HOD23223.1 DNA adenine methylase [Polyangiaceae bacterium]HOE51648.1 DNA adenine methylase [Polyangiaceae bacterium]
MTLAAPKSPEKLRTSLPRALPVGGPWLPPSHGPQVPFAKPFVKWAGGKRKLVPLLLRHAPKTFGTYHEPFVGGGALFYALRPSRAVLTDANARLVRTYRGIRDDVEGVIERLRSYPHDHDFFMKLRKTKVDEGSDADVAAWFVYLNKTGFNGLYRVNRNNEFNVPFGDQPNPTICDEDNLRACSRTLRQTDIEVQDFSEVLTRARKGDLVYFDPPYLPLSASSSFVAYTQGGFGPQDHERLRDVALMLKRRGVHVLLSNSAHPLVRELYGKHFHIEEVLAARAINSRGDRRGPIRELVIH